MNSTCSKDVTGDSWGWQEGAGGDEQAQQISFLLGLAAILSCAAGFQGTQRYVQNKTRRLYRDNLYIYLAEAPRKPANSSDGAGVDAEATIPWRLTSGFEQHD